MNFNENKDKTLNSGINAERLPIEPEMIFVEGGTFLMGATTEQGKLVEDEELPTHQVTVNSFNIGKYPVTQGQWKALMETDIKKQRDKANIYYNLRGEGDNNPMYYVSWDDAQEFISRLNEKSKKNYRLPTEAEWEYAARGGSKSKGYKHSGSNNCSKVAWFNDNSGYTTHPVGKKKPNELGIFDMNGNVKEWCSDWKGKYSEYPHTNPYGPSEGEFRIMRGGCWYEPSSRCRVAYRFYEGQQNRYNDCGFRLALSE